MSEEFTAAWFPDFASKEGQCIRETLTLLINIKIVKHFYLFFGHSKMALMTLRNLLVY